MSSYKALSVQLLTLLCPGNLFLWEAFGHSVVAAWRLSLHSTTIYSQVLSFLCIFTLC